MGAFAVQRSRHGPVNLEGMVLKVHFVFERHVADLAVTAVAGLQLGLVFAPEMLAQIARGIELPDEIFDLRILLGQGECLSDTEEASPWPLLLTADEDGYRGGIY